MIWLICVAVILAVAYFQYRNGLFTAAAMFVQVILAGLIAFNFWEPVADMLDSSFQRTMLAGTEDLIALATIFCIALGVMRTVTNRLAPELLDFHGYTQQIAAGVVGLLTGYLVAGFLVCGVQTLPLDEKFLGYEPRGPSATESGLTSLFPPDRVWLAMMRYAGAYPLTWSEDHPDGDTLYDRYQTFDRGGTFELRYLRYRRHNENRGPLPYQGEFNRDLYR
jgi:hypothetical protein